MPKEIKTTVFAFNELSKEAKEKAIEQVRESYYQYNDFAEWAIEDDYLFEPKHKDLIELFGTDFYEKMNKGSKYKDEPMLGNTRKNIYFDTDKNSFLDCENALTINNKEYFLKWLGIPETLEVDYNIHTPSGRNRDTIIEISLASNDAELTPEIETILQNAETKFNNHISDCLDNIKKNIEFRFTDEAITEDIESNEPEFTEEGKIFKHQ